MKNTMLTPIQKKLTFTNRIQTKLSCEMKQKQNYEINSNKCQDTNKNQRYGATNGRGNGA